MAAQDCIDAINAATGEKLTEDEVLAIAEQVEMRRKRLVAEGRLDNLDARLREAARDEADKVRLAAALQRKHAALTAIARDRLEKRVADLAAQGLNYRKAVLAILEGTSRGLVEGRHSVAATKQAFEGRYLGDMLAAFERERPHIVGRLRDTLFLNDVVREMFELRDGGKPGVTKNADAQFAAKTFATFAERSRTDLNRLGANIGKLDGWAGPQVHDSYKLLQVTDEAWTAAILPRLDLARSFPDVDPTDTAALKKILAEVYLTITTGRDNTITAKEKGAVTGPANLAKSLAKHRVLHFKSADDWLSYSRDFGRGNIFTSMIAHQERAARLAAQMQMMGPNPEAMLDSLRGSLARRIRSDPRVKAKKKHKLITAIEKGERIESALAEIRGLTLAPIDVTAGKLFSEYRGLQASAKLAGAILASVNDLVTSSINLRYQGKNIFAAYGETIGKLATPATSEEREIAYLAGEGFDGLIDNIIGRFYAEDGPPGFFSHLTTKVMKWQGLTWWTDKLRAVNVRIMSAWMGSKVGQRFDQLGPAYQHVLSQHGILAPQWDAIRQAQFRSNNGNVYVTADRVAALPDAAFDQLIASDVAAARAALKVDEAKSPETIAKREAQLEERTKRIRDRARLELELALRRFFADEAQFAILEADVATRRVLLRGTLPGTVWGEAARLVAQFKSFPVAFTQRVLGRAVLGGRGRNAAERLLNQSGHIGHLVAGLLVAGYASMTLKDAVRGQTPRDPTKWRTIVAALAQSGGAGIYGDFLFGQANRFGNSALETLAGPGLGGAAGLINLAARTRDGDVKAGEYLNIALQNTPVINLWYARPALDWLILNALREELSPGYLRRQERQRRKDYGQEYFLPRTAFEF
jgi:hypothetical protein